MEFKIWFLYNEVNWESDFSDVDKKCVNTKKIVDYLNAVRANAEKDYGSRDKFPINMPFVHSKSDFFKKEDKEVDVDYFIKQITTPPKSIINQNEKIKKSGMPNEFVYKTGIPAYRGIVFDIKSNKFYFINTCPGAGQCAIICYARKGRYIQYSNAYDSMTRRLNYLLNFPEKYEEQMYEELKEKCEEHDAYVGYKPKVIVRWNDSGDFFARKYVEISDSVMKRLKREGYNIESYAYTKIPDIKDSSINTTFSIGGKESNLSKVKKDEKKSEIIPKELFKDLNLLKFSDEKELKKRVSDEYRIPIDKIITYDELLSTTPAEEPKWHVIVTPNDGDDAAFRKDVKLIFLTQH